MATRRASLADSDAGLRAGAGRTAAAEHARHRDGAEQRGAARQGRGEGRQRGRNRQAGVGRALAAGAAEVAPQGVSAAGQAPPFSVACRKTPVIWKRVEPRPRAAAKDQVAAERNRPGPTVARARTNGRRAPSDQNTVGHGKRITAAVMAATAVQRSSLRRTAWRWPRVMSGEDVGPSTQAGTGVGTRGGVHAKACCGAG